jgi:hypothetical protein
MEESVFVLVKQMSVKERRAVDELGSNWFGRV